MGDELLCAMVVGAQLKMAGGEIATDAKPMCDPRREFEVWKGLREQVQGGVWNKFTNGVADWLSETVVWQVMVRDVNFGFYACGASEFPEVVERVMEGGWRGRMLM